MTIPTKIEIFGAGFRNKGANLMLLTVIDQLRDRYGENVKACIEPGSDRPFKATSSLPAAYLYPPAIHTRPRRHWMHYQGSIAFGKFAPRVFFEQTPLVRRQETKALIDISGYGFGDKWEDIQMKMFLHRCRYYARRKLPIILLPQMLGPFERDSSIRIFKEIAARASLIFARDDQSLLCAQAAAENHNTKIVRSPDITIGSHNHNSPQKESVADVLIVPNEKILTHGDPGWRDHYVDRLLLAGKTAQSGGLSVAVLVHSADRGDEELGATLAKKLGDVPVLTHSDPRVLKDWISGCKFIVASRFHAVVAALSQSVPAITIGWAHKYEELLKDFDQPNLLHRLDNQTNELEDLVKKLMTGPDRERVSGTIKLASEQLRSELGEVWSKTFDVLDPVVRA